jgi:hypothetical protein
MVGLKDGGGWHWDFDAGYMVERKKKAIIRSTRLQGEADFKSGLGGCLEGLGAVG